MAVLSAKETMEHFQVGHDTLYQLFRAKGSPAFKVGKNWRVDSEEFKEFLKKESERFKG